MITPHLKQTIDKLISKYPSKNSALIPVLDLVQRQNNNWLSHEDINEVAKIFHESTSRVFGVATYYTLFNTKAVGKYHLQIDTNVPALLMGALEIVAHLEKKLKIKVGETTSDGLFTLSVVEDLGSCGTCPVIQVNDVYYENMTREKVDHLIDSLRKGEMPSRETQYYFGTECNILLKNREKKNAATLQVYQETGGYQSLRKVQQMKPQDVRTEVQDAQLRGRGGAGFPAGTKWGFLPKDDPRPVYLICNADEGEPGTFKDRQIMEYDPHLLIEGIVIAAFAVGAKKAFIYIRGEFRWISTILENAIDEAEKAGLLKNLEIIVHRGAGSYVCGEETALIESIEGKRGNPRYKPPFPANIGLYGCPTVVNNVETLACLPFIIEKGAEGFREIGVTNNYGPKLFGVSGHVKKHGVYEFPLGTPLSKIIETAGGVQGKLKAVIVGGLSTPLLTAQEASTLNMSYDDCQKAGTALGSGGIIVMNDTTSIPQIALRTIQFYAHESCGQCTPCREGSFVIKQLLKKILRGQGETKDLDSILSICDPVIGLTLCPTGEAFARPIRAMIRKFRNEFDALVQH